MPVPVDVAVFVPVAVPVDAGVLDGDCVGVTKTDAEDEGDVLGVIDTMVLRDAVLDAVRAGVIDVVALREAVSVGVRLAIRETVILEDIEPDPLALVTDVIVADLLEDMDTEPDLEVDDEVDGDANGDGEGVPDTAEDLVGVPEAGIVATSNPITGGGIQSAIGADVSAQGRAYTPN